MPIIVRIRVENPDEILNAGHSGAGAVVQLQRDTTSAFGAPTDVTTVPIVTAIRSYTAYDASGTSSSWYRTRYETSGGTGTSDWSDPFQVGGETGGLIPDLNDIRQRFRMAPTDTSNDEDFLDFARAVTDHIHTLTGRIFVPDQSDVTHYFTGDETPLLHVPRGVRSITSIGYALEDQPSDGTGTYNSITVTKVYLRPVVQERLPGWPALWLRLGSTAEIAYWPCAQDGIKLVYKGGFAAVPPRLQDIATKEVVRLFQAKQAGQADIVGEDAAGGLRIFGELLRSEKEYIESLGDGSRLVA